MRLRMMTIVACLLARGLAQLQLIHAAHAATATPAAGDEGFANLVAWMQSHGGRVDPRIDIAITHNGVRGAVALSQIEEGTELLFCPWKLIIGSTGIENQMQSGDGMCAVVREMADEVRHQSESLWKPYLDHIVLPRLAASWNTDAVDELQGLPPFQEADRHERWYTQICHGELDDAATFALVAFISRASEVGMVPIYDLLNHHNGRRNAKLFIGEEGVQLLSVGSGNIQEGDEIYLSYGLKAASQMYRDNGFVEEWPSVWNFRDAATSDNFAFVQLAHGIMAINPSAEYLKSMWTSNLSQGQYEAEARGHTASLSVQELERFAHAAHARLDEFQSTLEEDRATLAGKESRLAEQRLASDDVDTSNAEDVISAIQYRMAFKSALTSSFLYAEATIRESLARQEL